MIARAQSVLLYRALHHRGAESARHWTMPKAMPRQKAALQGAVLHAQRAQTLDKICVYASQGLCCSAGCRITEVQKVPDIG
eukprot:738722-Pelagomonas_calceolata.AAC.2